MKGVAKEKVVTSGRLTGKVKPQSQRRLIPNPKMAVFPEPAYSLYSSDSQEQVASLHNSLDRYDAFLSGILQADESDLGGPKDAAVRSKLPASSGRKIVKKTPAKAVADRKSHATPQGAGITTPRTTRHPMVPVAHSGVMLFPTRKKYQNTLSRLQTQHHTPSAPRHADPVSAPGSKPRHKSGEEDFIPVRDISPQIGNLKTPEKNQAEEVKDPCSADDEGEVKMQTVQYLLRELKALIIGEGSLAEMLLRRLEQAMTSPLVNASIQSDADVLLLQSQNIQLRRDVEELQQQLKLREQAEIEKGNDLCSSQVSVMEKDLTAALSQLHELQDNLRELQKAHQDTQNQLKEKEMINTLIVSDLEATRNRLLDSEREKDELTTQYQQRLKEVEHLKRDLQSRFSSSDCTFVGSSVSQQPRDEEVTEHVNHYLMSMWPETTAGDRAPENGQTAVQQGGPPAENAARGGPRQDLEPGLRKDLPHERMSSCTMSQCDADSLCSDWSLKSGSTFNARDEAAFRDGLSALDTSIANLLKSFQLHHERKCS